MEVQVRIREEAWLEAVVEALVLLLVSNHGALLVFCIEKKWWSCSHMYVHILHSAHAWSDGLGESIASHLFLRVRVRMLMFHMYS